VPTLGGAISSGEPVMRAGAFDQGAFAARADVLAFQTAPLAKALEIAGPVAVRLWIASDAPDTDFTAKLIDIHPPSADFPHGFALNLTEGLLRVRYRDSWERPTPMVPGEVYPITIELFPIANLFCRGHRLRLDISSSNFPHFDVNPNSGEAEGMGWQPRIARSRIYVDRSRPRTCCCRSCCRSDCRLRRHCGAQERSVPARNGTVTDESASGHMTQAGAALAGAGGDADTAVEPDAVLAVDGADAVGVAGVVALVCADPWTAGAATSDTAMPSR
jgi:X-Pro dipeptidyl-peptidase C-terminal non-catalytic domain